MQLNIMSLLYDHSLIRIAKIRSIQLT